MWAGIFVTFRWVETAAAEMLRVREGLAAVAVRSIGCFDLDFVADDADFVDVCLDAGIVAPGTVCDAKAPSVPRTDDGAFVDFAIGKGRAHVWATIVDGVILAVEIEDCDQAITEREGLALAFGNGAYLGDGDEVRHVDSKVYGSEVKVIGYGVARLSWAPRAIYLANYLGPTKRMGA